MARPEDGNGAAEARTDEAVEAVGPEAEALPTPAPTPREGTGIPVPAADPDADAEPGPAAEPADAQAAEAVEAVPWQTLAEGWEREAAARGEGPEAARLWHEAGLVYEERLSRPRQAAACYQTAFRIDPAYRPNLHSARRLFAAVGNWSMVAQLLQAEAEVAGDPAVRAALLFERGALLRERLGRAEEAAPVLAAAREAAGDDLALLAYLATVAAREGDVDALARTWREAAGATDAPAVRVAFLCAAAGLYTDRLDDPDTGRGLYEEAHRLDPRHPVAIEALLRLAEQRGDFEALVSLLEAAAETAPGPTEAAVSLHQAARVAREVLGHQEEAARLLEAARSRAPGDPAILDELARAHEAAGRDEAQAEVLAALADHTRDPRVRVEVLHRLGRLLDEGLGRTDEAAAAYRRILDDSPGSAEALAALGRLYFRAGRWDDLVWTFEQEMAATDDPKQRATRLFRIAEIQRVRKNDVELALVTLHRVLDLEPGYHPALSTLASIYREREDWAALIALHERALEAVQEDPAQRIHLLELIGSLQEERLGDLEAAVRTAERVLTEAPDHLPTVRRLQRLHERLGRWEHLVREVEREAEIVGDQRQAVALLQRACELREERLGDRDDAIAGWQRVLALQPNYLPALRALGRLYQQKGRWAELAAMYRQELEVSASPDQAVALLLRIARIQEERLLDESGAIDTYQRILDHKPDALVALRALRRLQGRRGAWDALVAVLRQEAEVVEDAAERARLFCAAAEVRERSGARDQAVAFYRQALEEVPGHVQALGALARLYGAAGAWRELARVYEQTLSAAPPGRRGTVWRRLAHLYLDRLGAPERAVQCLEAVLAEDPDDPLSLLLLERVRLGQGELEPALQTGGRLADAAETARTGAALLQGVALTGETLEGQDGVQPWARILQLDPDDFLAARRMEVAARRVGDDRALVELFRRRRDRAETDDERLSLSMRIADAALRIGESGTAEVGYREVLDLAPTHLPALRGLRRLMAEADRWPEVRGLLEREAAASRDPDRAIDLGLEAAAVCADRLGDREGAEAALRGVLARRPGHPEAFDRLRTLLTAAGRWQVLADACAARAAHLEADAARCEAWEEVARLRLTRLDDLAGALEAAEAALEAGPDDADLRALAGDLAWGLERWDLAARHYDARLEAGGTDADLLTPRLRLAVIHQSHRPDPQRAIAHLEDVLAAAPDHHEALERLAVLQTADERWEAAARTLARLAEVERATEARIEVLLRLAGLQSGRLGRPEEAIETLAEVRRLDPDHAGAAERLAALYEATRDWEPLVATYREVVRLLPAGADDRAWAIHARIATILSDHLDDPEGAAEAWREAVAVRPDDSGARLALAELRASRPEGLGEAVAQHRAILARDPDRLESLEALFRLFQRQEAWDKAWCTASLLQALDAGSQATADLLAYLGPDAAPVPSGVLSQEDHATRLLHPDARGPLGEVIAAVGNHLARIHPQDLEAFGVTRSDRIQPRDDSPLRTVTDALMAALGGGDYDLYRTERPGRIVEVLAGDPPAVVVGGDLLRREDPVAQRFLLARVLEQARTGTGLVSRLDPLALAALVQACAETVLPEPPTVAPPDPDLTRRCARVLPRKARRRLQGPAERLAQRAAPDLERYVSGVRRGLDRVGALLCGDPGVALRVVAAEHGWAPGRIEGREAVAALLRFLLDEPFFELRRRLGLAAAGPAAGGPAS